MIRVVSLLVYLLASTSIAQTCEVVISNEMGRPINVPAGLEIRGDVLTVADAVPLVPNYQGRLRQLSGQTYTTKFGGLNFPWDVVTGADGKLYVTETFANRIVRIDNGVGTPIVASQASPRGIAQYGSGLVWVNMDNNGAVPNSVFTYNAGTVLKIAGTGKWGDSGDNVPAIQSALKNPFDVTQPDEKGAIYISQMTGNRVSRIDAAGIIKTIAGVDAWAGDAGDNGPAGSSRLNNPTSLKLHGKDLYIVDQANGKIKVVTNVVDLGPSAIIKTVYSGIYPRWIDIDATYIYMSIAEPPQVIRCLRADVTPIPQQPTPSRTSVVATPANTSIPATPTNTVVPATATPISACDTWRELGNKIGCP